MKKNISASIRERLLKASKKMDVDYQVVLTRYFHERFLFRLACSPYKDNFCLKGDTLLFAYEKFMARPTLDMDFSAERNEEKRKRVSKVPNWKLRRKRSQLVTAPKFRSS